MKRFAALSLVFSMVFAIACCFVSCDKLPTDYIKGDEVVVDNETPFVYD